VAEGKSEILELIVKFREAMTGPLKQLTKHTKEFEEQLERTEATSKKLKSLAVAGGVFLGMSYAVKEGLEHLIEPAIEFAHAQNALQRATGAGVEQLKEFAEQAHHIAATLPVSATEVTEAQATLTRILGSTEGAMEAMSVTAQFAAATNMKAADAAILLGSAYETMGDRQKPLTAGFTEITDKLALLQSKYSTSEAGGELLARSFAHLALASRTFGVSVNQSAALLGVLNKSGLGGGRGAGSYAQEIISQIGKLDKYGIPQIQRFGIALARNSQGGIDLVKTIANLRSVSQNQATAYIKSLGAAGQALTLLYQHYDELKGAVKDFGNVAGDTARLAALAGQDPAARFKVFHQVVEQLEESLGSALLPVLLQISRALTPIIEGFANFAEAHPIVMGVVLSVTALLAAFIAVGGAIALVAAGVGELISVFALLRMGIVLARSAMVAFDAAALLNPIGVLVAGFAAVAALAAFLVYEIYSHWEQIKKVFSEGWAALMNSPVGAVIKSVEMLLGKAFDWGSHFITNLVSGIKSGISKVHDAMTHVGQVIRSYIPFSGAMQNVGAVSRASRVTAAPAARRIALATAALMPTLMTPALAPVLAASSAGSGSHGPVAVHFNVTMHGAQSGDAAQVTLDLFRQHQDEFTALVEDAMDRSRRNGNRTGF
jgi:TP901 family phage tail tape measure protein